MPSVSIANGCRGTSVVCVVLSLAVLFHVPFQLGLVRAIGTRESLRNAAVVRVPLEFVLGRAKFKALFADHTDI